MGSESHLQGRIQVDIMGSGVGAIFGHLFYYGVYFERRIQSSSNGWFNTHYCIEYIIVDICRVV
jgi:hypothetical protein